MAERDRVLLDRAMVLDALEELVDVLRERGVQGGIRVIGGAAIAIQYDEDRARTTDVDAILHPKDAVLDAAREVATRRAWRPEWLNDKALAFMTHHDEASDWTVVLERGDVTVSVASPELLLAMKLKACRGVRDGEDVLTLAEACGVSSIEDAARIFDRYYPDEVMKDRGQRWLGAWLRGEDPFDI